MKRYKERDIEHLGNYYINHVIAMTKEGLHSKSEIAAELAWRDYQLDRCKRYNDELVEKIKTERETIKILRNEVLTNHK